MGGFPPRHPAFCLIIRVAREKGIHGINLELLLKCFPSLALAKMLGLRKNNLITRTCDNGDILAQELRLLLSCIGVRFRKKARRRWKPGDLEYR